MASRTFEDLIKTGAKLTAEDERIVTAEIGKAYKAAYDKAIKDLADLYSKLGDKLDLVEARKYKRLEGLLQSIEKEYYALTKTAIKASGNVSFQAYKNAFETYTWSMENAVVDGTALNVSAIMKMDIAWGVVPTAVIEASIMSEASGLTYIKTFDKNAAYRLSDIQATITRGIASGSGYRKIASELKNAFNRGLSDAMRVIVTEMGRNYTEGFLKANNKAIAAGIDVKKRWDATLDGRTRSSHAAEDGKYADEDGNFHVGLSVGPGPGLLNGPDMLAQIINCRCRVTDELVGFPPKLRRIGGEIQEYQTFADWAGDSWSPKTGWKK